MNRETRRATEDEAAPQDGNLAVALLIVGGVPVFLIVGILALLHQPFTDSWGALRSMASSSQRAGAAPAKAPKKIVLEAGTVRGRITPASAARDDVEVLFGIDHGGYTGVRYHSASKPGVDGSFEFEIPGRISDPVWLSVRSETWRSEPLDVVDWHPGDELVLELRR